MYNEILFDFTAGVARITLNRPAKLNALTPAMQLELQDALTRLQAEPCLRVLLITGAGRGFCAGADLTGFAAQAGTGPMDLEHLHGLYYSPMVEGVRALKVPVVCAVNGVAAGAGMNFALAADIVVATESAKFSLPFAKLGLLPDTGGTYLLPRLIGMARATAISMLAETFTAREAETWGMIWKCLPDAEFAAEVETLVARLASSATLALGEMKACLAASLTNTLPAQLAMEGAGMGRLGRTQDFARGLAAFATRSTPSFEGK